MWLSKRRARKKTDELVAMANVLAITSFQPMVANYPALNAIVADDGLPWWDFIMTIAGTAAGMELLRTAVGPREYKDFSAALIDSLNAWGTRGNALRKQSLVVQKAWDSLSAFNRRGNAAFANLSEFVRTRVERGMEMPDAIGLWVLWNVHRDAPTELKAFRDEELEIAPMLGMFLFASFERWWD